MKIFFYACLVWFFTTKILLACNIQDDVGNVLQFKSPPTRIIVLSPDLTEILFVVGAGQQVVGVMQGSDFPADKVKTLPVVASFNHLDREKIVSLKPDLIVTWKEVSFLSQLKDFSVPVYVSEPKKLLDISRTIQQLGCLTGHQQAANHQAELFNKTYADLARKYSNQKKLSVFYQVWPKPLMTISGNNWINEMITLCGGENIFANLMVSAPTVTDEAVLAHNPDVIIGKELSNWRMFSQLTAVSQHHLISLDTDLIERPGPRILVGVSNVCEQLEKVRHAFVR